MKPDLIDTDARCGATWLAHLDDSGRSGVLVALISRFNHDLRTPLNTILGWTHLLQKGSVDSARAKHVADIIARNSRDQTQLLEDFVDDGRAVLKSLQLQIASVSIDEVVARANERIGDVLMLHGALLRTEVDVTGVSVSGDTRRLERLVYRLLAVVARRAPEGSTIKQEADIAADGSYVLSLSGSTVEHDWSDAALLELRISTLVAALNNGTLHVGAEPTRPCVQLSLPRL